MTNHELESKTNFLATKEDIHSIKEDISKFIIATNENFHSFKEEFYKLNLATKEELSKSILLVDAKCAALDTKISETKSETMKWMFTFWVGQAITIIGLILMYFLK
jgi:hypothetical protein